MIDCVVGQTRDRNLLMPIKKSDLYSKLWASCDELRGGMDASQYKDYVLVLLFIKYISDKYAGQPFAAIQVPEGASFADMVALKGKSDIGDQINKKIIRPLEEANRLRIKADFNDDALLGQGKEKVDKLTNLIGIFESKELDFSKHRADGDDILGDAYEYLMRHFATESGKSKGQFYTPAEVSRVMAQVLGIAKAKTSPDTTVYDPTCGSGSLLLKVAEAAPTPVTVYGQEKEEVTSGLARMNMILHHNPGAVIEQGNTLADPKFLDGDQLKTFDYVVANPPFSDKRWSNGLVGDAYARFDGFGTPPDKQGDYAYLLHIIRSLKSTGRAACILPHGVLFRGNAEAEIRKSLVRRGLIQAIIGLPANLFYGTGIPACILVIDKADLTRRRIFETEAFGFFHLGDAWTEGDDILFDLALHRDMDFAARGATEVIEGVPQDGEAARLGLIRLKSDGSTELIRTPVIAEFPRSDPRRAGVSRRLSIHTTAASPDTPFAQAIAVTDWSSGRTRSFDFGADHVVDEMVYVAKPGTTDEAEGWLIGPSLNLAERTTELHVLDVARIEDGPVATWRADVALPAAFHGVWAG